MQKYNCTLFLFLCACLLSNRADAQDTIYCFNGKVILGRIKNSRLMEADSITRSNGWLARFKYRQGYIRYSAEGPRRLDQDMIDSIHYSNGKITYMITPYVKTDTIFWRNHRISRCYMTGTRLFPLHDSAEVSGIIKSNTFKPGLIFYWWPGGKYQNHGVYEDFADSIRYADGHTLITSAARLHYPVPSNYIEIINFGILPAAAFTFAYERRLSRKIAIRCPLSIGWGGFVMPAGVLSFIPHHGQLYYLPHEVNDLKDSASHKGWDLSAGFNPLFYCFSQKAQSVYIGPELTAGYMVSKLTQTTLGSTGHVTSVSYSEFGYETFTAIFKAGIRSTPKSGPSIALDAGIGLGGVFGKRYAYGYTGVIQLGLKIGANWY